MPHSLIASCRRRDRSALHVPAVLLVTLCAAISLSGCGNKGPLYLPPAAPITEVGPGDAGTEAQQETEQPDESDQQP